LLVLVASLAPVTKVRADVAAARQGNVDHLVSTKFPKPAFNRATGTYDTVGKVLNRSSDRTLLAPMSLVVTSTSLPDVTLANPSGTTTDGLPFVAVPLPGGRLGPQETTAGVLLRFQNPSRQSFTFTTSVRAVVDAASGDVTAPQVTILSPPGGTVFSAQPIAVAGEVDDKEATVRVNGVLASVSRGRFIASSVPLLRDGTSVVSAVATDPAGNTGQDSITVILDTLPPTVVADSPPDGFRTSQASVAVAGMVSDVITTTPTVTVNGIAAAVSNGTFITLDVPLNPGKNLITVAARDGVGNVGTDELTIHRETQPGLRLEILGGQAQTALVSSVLPLSLRVRLLSGLGDPVAGRELLWEVARGDGSMSDLVDPMLADQRSLRLLTDGVGESAVTFRLGSRTGAGNNRARVSVGGGLSFVEFCATATSGTPDRLAIVHMTNHQTGVINLTLADSFAAIVLDLMGNPVAGVPVTFTAVEGGGSFDTGAMKTVSSGPDGAARALLTLGPEAGVENNAVEAEFAGLQGPPALFLASARAAGAEADTAFSGIVLDNLDLPLQNARARIEGTAREAVTDASGRFRITQVPPGAQRLFIDGSQVVDGRGSIYPNLEFDVVAISGTDNSLPFPIYLPPLADAVMITGTETLPVVLRMPGVPESTLTILPGSVRRADGSPPTPENPIGVRLSRVNNDRVPMPPPNGSVFMLAGTVQPAGTHFDPPAPICVPNAGMPPGAQVDIFSFDHDVGQFLTIGLATVSEDGSVLCSNAGFGITKAGWWGCTPPPPPTTDAKSCRVTAVTANPNPVCLPDIVGPPITEEITITATVCPGDKVVSWSGDLGITPMISGNTLRTRYGTTGEKVVTATCEQSRRSVTVRVVRVRLEINNTADENDDITLFNNAPAAQAHTQTIQARVTVEGAAADVALSIMAASRATVAPATLSLGAGASGTVTITPRERSAAANDVLLIASVSGRRCTDEDMTNVSVVLPQIRRANTPARMPDRIPPRVDTDLSVMVMPDLAGSGQMVRLAAQNTSAANGNFTINGGATADITTTGDVHFRGTAQTTPGNHNNLRVRVQVRGQDTSRSDGFAVSSIPITWTQTSVADGGGGVIVFRYSWESDSGTLGDLDQVWIGEHVTYDDGGTHVAAGRPWRGNNPDPTILPARTPGGGGLSVSGVARDTHSPPGGLPRAGPADMYVATQNYGFRDYRTENAPADNTLGWQINLVPAIAITRVVENTGTAMAPMWRYTITKSGSTVMAPLP
jgi:hypothetical protein